MNDEVRAELERVWGEIDKAIVAGSEGQGDWLPPDVGTAILAVACMKVRNEALEEAAQEVESWDPDYRTSRVLADDIRGLKE